MPSLAQGIGTLCTALLCAITAGTVMAHASQGMQLTLRVVDAVSHSPLGARVTLMDQDGVPYFFEANEPNGKAIAYRPPAEPGTQQAHGMNAATRVSPHRVVTRLPRGRFTLVVTCGPCYWPSETQLEVTDPDDGTKRDLTVALVRWATPSARGWYAGDTSVEGDWAHLPTLAAAEDLQVALAVPPVAAATTGQPEASTRVVGVVSESLHSTAPQDNPPFPRWESTSPVRKVHGDLLSGAVLAQSITAPNHVLYDLVDQHMTQARFGSEGPIGIAEPSCQRSRLDMSQAIYHRLLNCGWRISPTAGSGQYRGEPIPPGAGRVYVHLAGPLTGEAWWQGLCAGRSFVSTGPLLLATINGCHPGEVFAIEASRPPLSVEIEVNSSHPLLYGELLVNGLPRELLRGKSEPVAGGSYLTRWQRAWRPLASGWMAVRVWQSHPDGDVRMAHTAPWYLEVAGEPLSTTRSDIDFWRARLESPDRSDASAATPTTPPSKSSLVQEARQVIAALPLVDDATTVARTSRPFVDPIDRARWLHNMIVDHQFSAEEVHWATGLAWETAQYEVEQRAAARYVAQQSTEVRLRPYPGGKHPRRGFLEGAVDPQRETKVSLFAPWAHGGYVVVDMPEAVFSNLGLTYLAHQHIPTIWDERQIKLPRLEWVGDERSLHIQRSLPNGIVISSRAQQTAAGADFRLELFNGSSEPLTGLRVQVCTMLAAATGFELQQPLQTKYHGPCVAVRSCRENRWILTAWHPLHRVWANPPVPCIHSDPQFPDCAAGATVAVRGALQFWEGDDPLPVMQAMVTQLPE